MHQSPLKQVGAPRRDKYALFDADGESDRRAERSSPPRARRFLREESPRQERGARQHPRA